MRRSGGSNKLQLDRSLTWHVVQVLSHYEVHTPAVTARIALFVAHRTRLAHCIRLHELRLARLRAACLVPLSRPMPLWDLAYHVVRHVRELGELP